MIWQKVFTVAIVGADGSGKSTIARHIVEADPGRFKCIYMGWSIESANHALPTSRLLAYWKRRVLREEIGDSALPPAALMPDNMKKKLPGGKLVKLLTLLNRIADEQYRQLVTWIFRLRGYIVIFDRHYLFEYYVTAESHSGFQRFIQSTHSRATKRLCRPPDLVIFLDAPAETLIERKTEWPIEHIKNQQAKISGEGKTTRNFVRVDASQSVEWVAAQVMEQIEKFQSARATGVTQS